MRSKSNGKARFDARITNEQKQLFEEAAALAGYKTLSEFIIVTLQQQSKNIIAAHHSFLSSEKDREIFFNQLVRPASPNTRLKSAAKRYKKMKAGK